MSEKTRLTPQLADTTYAHTLVIKSTHEYKVHGTIWPMDLVYMSTFDNQSMSIGCVGKLGGSVWFSQTLPLKAMLAMSSNYGALVVHHTI